MGGALVGAWGTVLRLDLFSPPLYRGSQLPGGLLPGGSRSRGLAELGQCLSPQPRLFVTAALQCLWPGVASAAMLRTLSPRSDLK